MSDKDALLTRMNDLERRLKDGYARIEAAQQNGSDVEKWEAFWMDLLRQYEALANGEAGE